MAVRAKNFCLSLGGEVGANLQSVPGAEAETPADPRISGGNLHHHLEEGRYVELVPAEAAGLKDAIEAGLQKFAVKRLGIVSALLGCRRFLADERSKRPRPFDDRGGGEIGLGTGNCRRQNVVMIHRSG